MPTPSAPGTRQEAGEATRELTQLIPRYHVVLLDDQEHTYDYVVEMLVRLFRHTPQAAFRMACEVDRDGRSVVFTTNREQAEHRRSQIMAYGPDPRLPHSRGSMGALVEPAE
ncbi:MAG: ATP-dependent Clp protease adaptor ClpS [Candidatus Latescibacterota bacterium]